MFWSIYILLKFAKYSKRVISTPTA